MQYALETVLCVVSSGFSLLHENTGNTDKHKMVIIIRVVQMSLFFVFLYEHPEFLSVLR